MSRKRRSQKRSQKNGALFENLIERTCTHYRGKGIADIKKTPEPMKPISPLGRGQFRAVYTKKGQPDFMGTLKGGRSVQVEAKHTQAKLIQFDTVQDHQGLQLQNTERLGGLALIVISFRFENFYALTWTEWQQVKKDTGKKSCNEKDLAEYKVDQVAARIQFLDRFIEGE